MDPLRLLGAAFIMLAPLLWGFPMYYSLVSSRGWLYLKSFREKLRYFFNPFMKPRFMVIVKRLDGRVDVYYDGDVRFEKSERGATIWLGGEVFRSDRAPDDFPPVPLASCFAPNDIFSPYGIAVRLVAGWYAAAMFSYIYGVTLVDWLGGLDALGWLTLTAFLVQVAYTFWLFMGVQSIPVTHRASYVEVGYTPPVHELVPDFGVFSNEPVDKWVKRLGGRLVFIVPEDLKQIFDELREKLGTAHQAVSLLVKVYEADLWRKALTEYRETEMSIREVGKSYARRWVLKHNFRITIPRLLVLAFIFVLGVVVGYVFGSTWAVTPAPPPWYNAATHTHAHQGYAGYAPSTATVMPASPPPPPGATHTPSVKPAQPPPPPGSTTTPTVTPAKMPPPPPTRNATGVRGA